MIFSNQYHLKKELKILWRLVQLCGYHRKGSAEKNDQYLQRHFYKNMCQKVYQKNCDFSYDGVTHSDQLSTKISVVGNWIVDFKDRVRFGTKKRNKMIF